MNILFLAEQAPEACPTFWILTIWQLHRPRRHQPAYQSSYPVVLMTWKTGSLVDIDLGAETVLVMATTPLPLNIEMAALGQGNIVDRKRPSGRDSVIPDQGFQIVTRLASYRKGVRIEMI